jgi:fumarate hydratase subunit alpha
MRIVEAALITETVKRLCIEANHNLPADVRERIRECRRSETWPAAQDTLDKIISNFELAEKRRVPICQDTGMACVFLEIGTGVYIQGDVNEVVHEGVRQGYREGYLRASVVADPLNRKNTGDNTPAMIYIDFVIDTVEAAGPNPCPPIVVGVGIGGNFDKAALLAKKALLRPLGNANPDKYYADLESTLLEKINALGIGPQGFGGATTALSVAVETMPTHIAGLPCAVNINCHVSRHVREVL